MFSLKNHPFAVETTFEKSVVLTFAIPKNELEKLIPECLELDVFEDQFAFIAVALVTTKNLRPKGFPEFFGNNFNLVGYRVFVKYIDNQGKKLRGLYILKSETNKTKMTFLGNLMSHYNYSTTDILFESQDEVLKIKSDKSGFNIVLNNSENALLPKNSIFENWKTARKFAGPLPFTFTYKKLSQEVLIIEGVRKNWIPKPIEVESFKIDFFNDYNFSNVKLSNAFIIENIPYYWKKGKIEKWKKQ
jgi:Uncharacterized conserved protein (COG2071)